MEPRTPLTGPILLIDDDRTVNFYNEWLVGRVFPESKTHIFENAEEALDWINQAEESNLPSLILLDLNLPGINGIEFTRILREQCPDASLKILMLLNSTLTEDYENQAREVGIEHFIPKPMEEEVLISIMAGK